jgi:hypothetical protein
MIEEIWQHTTKNSQHNPFNNKIETTQKHTSWSFSIKFILETVKDSGNLPTYYQSYLYKPFKREKTSKLNEKQKCYIYTFQICEISEYQKF